MILYFQQELLRGEPLHPKHGAEWTLGDLIFLAATVNMMVGTLREYDEANFRTPLSRIFNTDPDAEAAERLPKGRHQS